MQSNITFAPAKISRCRRQHITKKLSGNAHLLTTKCGGTNEKQPIRNKIHIGCFTVLWNPKHMGRSFLLRVKILVYVKKTIRVENLLKVYGITVDKTKRVW